jgi:hypothetical protein
MSAKIQGRQKPAMRPRTLRSLSSSIVSTWQGQNLRDINRRFAIFAGRLKLRHFPRRRGRKQGLSNVEMAPHVG